MTRALIYQSHHQWRFALALAAAVFLHFAAVGFANIRKVAPRPAAPDFPEIQLVDPSPIENPTADEIDPMPAPPRLEQTFFEAPATRPPVRKQVAKVAPIAKARTNLLSGSVNLSTAKILALNAPRPEYPYEARRQKIIGDGIVVMTVDPASGDVVQVAIAKSTGNSFLDNAVLTGFKRWRFKPGTISSVTCPVTFALTGASY
jgi:protein TonB